jgi:prepilin-type N-terminal cleavage/methylation domain-containing protein
MSALAHPTVRPARRADRRRRAGFSLIELLIVVVIIGILAAIAIPAFANTKGKALVAKVKSDLRQLATAEEGYYYGTGQYTTDLSLLGLAASPGVTLTIVSATASGWSATGSAAGANPTSCALFYGTAAPIAPATVEGVLTCQ